MTGAIKPTGTSTLNTLLENTHYDITRLEGYRRCSGDKPVLSLLMRCQSLKRIFKALHGRVDDACANLANPWQAMCDACIYHGWHIQAAYLANVDARRRSSKVQ